MSISGINSNVNVNTQAQQNNKSKVIPPVVGAAVGTVAGAGKVVNSNYKFISQEIKSLQECIQNQKKTISFYELSLLSDSSNEYDKHCIKEAQDYIKKFSAKIIKYKQDLKPMGMLKGIAKGPLTYILGTAGLAVGLYINHRNSKAATQKEGLNSQV